MMEILQNILTIVLPSLVTAYVFNRIMKRLDDDKKARDDHMFMLIGLSMAAVELSEATAISYKNGRCNGEMTAALERAQKIKSEYTDFLTKRCVGSIQ